ncbi:MAG: ECF transporter S component [Anaerolineae bacterium]|nr:ECF transporter S component [Anaerolineae bacterium]
MSTETVVQSTPARKIVIAGVMGALAVFLGWTHLGFIPWVAGAALTIMHVPVIIGAVLEGPVVGTAIGLIFGLFSLLQAVLAPTGPVDVWFQNPVISVLPRLFIGVVAWLGYKALKNVNEPLALVVAGILGTLTNTVLVLSAIGLFGHLPWGALPPIAIANGLPEAVLAAILTVAVVVAWKRIETGTRKSKM